MKTPRGNNVKWTALGNKRWRLSMGTHELFIEKTGPSYTFARLEHKNGDIVGDDMEWADAVKTALKVFDVLAKGEEQPYQDFEPKEYRVVWTGKTARDCSTVVMEYVDSAYWDNVTFVSLHIVDWGLRRVVHTIEVPIDEKAGWEYNDAVEKVSVMIEDLEKILRRHWRHLEDGTMKFGDIQI